MELQRLHMPLCEVESDAQEQLVVERSSARIYPEIVGTERPSIQEEHEDGQAGEGARAVHEDSSPAERPIAATFAPGSLRATRARDRGFP